MKIVFAYGINETQGLPGVCRSQFENTPLKNKN